MIFSLSFGVVLGALLLSLLFSFFLLLNGIEKKLNLTYSGFASFLFIYVFFNALQYDCTSIPEFVFVYKILNVSLQIAGVFFILLFQNLTGYRNKYFVPFLFFSLLFLFIINLAAPYGFTFSSVSESKISGVVFGKPIYEHTVIVSKWMYAAIVFLIILFIYMLAASRHYLKSGDLKGAKILFGSLAFGVGALIIHNIFVLFSVKGFYFIQYLGIVAFINIVSHRNLISILKSIELTKEHLKSRERLKKLFDSSDEGILFLENGIIADANEQSYNIFRYDKNEILGKKFEELFDTISSDILNRSFNEKEEFSFSLSGKKKGCSIFPVKVKARIINIGERNFWVLFIADITEIMDVLEDLKNSEERFKHLADASFEGIIFTDEWKIIDCNDQLLRMLEYGKEELLGNDMSMILSKDTMKTIKDIMDFGGEAPYEIFIIDKRGKYIPVEVRTKIINVKNKKLRVSVVRNLTIYKESENALKQANEKLETVLNSAIYTGIISVTTDGIITLFSKGAEKLIGYNAEEVVGKETPMLFHLEEEINTRGRELSSQLGFKIDGMNVFHVLAMRNGSDDYEWTIVRKDGKRIYVTLTVTPVRDQYNEIVQFLGIAVDITERVEAEREIKNSEQRFRTIFENANDAIFIMKGDVFIQCNSRTLEMFGCTKEQIIGETPGRFSPEFQKDGRSSKEQSVNKINLALNGEKQFFEWTHTRNDGSLFEAEVSLNKINFDNEIFIQAIVRDITERKNAEKVLKESEEKYKTLLEGMNEAVIQVDSEDRVLFINKKFTDILGYTIDEIYGKKAHEILLEPDQRHIMLEYAKQRQKGISSQYEIFFNNKVGEKICFLISASPLKNNSDEVIGSIGVMTDITLLKKADLALKNAMSFINYVINSVPISIIAVDNELNVTHYNHESVRYSLNNGNSTIYESEYSSKFPQLKFTKNLIDKCIKERRNVSDVVAIAGDDGEIKHYSISVNMLENEYNPGNVILVEDITERKKIEQMMIQSEKMLSVAGLAAGMAHEINNPLGTIVQGCQNILRRTTPGLSKNAESAAKAGINIGQIEEYFKERKIYDILYSIKDAADKSAEIIRNMLQFSRRSESKKVLCSVQKLLDETVELAYSNYDLKKLYDLRSIIIEKDYDEYIPDIKITITEIQQVIFNILKNAAQAIKGENNPNKLPKIIIRLKKEPRFLCIELEDNGPGMDEKIKSRIFEPFFTTKDVGEGTGLGLSVAYMIITTNHQGILSVDSVPGKGTIFSLRLPYQGGKNE